MDKKYKKWSKTQREWAKQLGVHITTVAKNGEEWCMNQAKIMAAESAREKALLHKKDQLNRLRKDLPTIDDSRHITDPVLAQQERIMSNTAILLDELLIMMVSTQTLTSEEYNAASIKLKLIDTVLKLKK